MPASATWTTKTVQITYRDPLTLLKEPGSYEAKISTRVVNLLADGTKQVFRPGVIAQGNLDTDGTDPSLSIDLPVIDDPDNTQEPVAIHLTVTFTNGGDPEHFELTPSESWPSVTDLADWAVT